MPAALTAAPRAAHQDLVDRASGGDARALASLAREVQPLLRAQARGLARRALSHSGADCDLDDLVSEVVAEVQVFLAAGESGAPGWQRFAVQHGTSLEGWLFGIVRNKLRRRVRDLRRHASILGAEPQASDEGVSPERALDGARALALARTLPPRERDALALWLTDAPTTEIAERLRFPSAHAVDCCLSRGKQRLRAMMEDPVALAA